MKEYFVERAAFAPVRLARLTKRIISLALSGALLSVSISGANATIIDVTYAGTVSFGFDENNLFDLGVRIAAGAAYKATYVFDTSLGNTSANYVWGGSWFGSASPALSSTVTINDRSVSLSKAH